MTRQRITDEKLALVYQVMDQNRLRKIQHIYLFLDFDGVINVFLDPSTPHSEEILHQRASKLDFADRDCVRRLDELLEDYPIDVVISSSWRYKGLDYCIQYLKNAGLKGTDKIVGTTSLEYNRTRAEEIADYLLAHSDYSGFLIVDDDPMPEFRKQWLETYPYKGFDEESKTMAHTILNAALTK